MINEQMESNIQNIFKPFLEQNEKINLYQKERILSKSNYKPVQPTKIECSKQIISSNINKIETNNSYNYSQKLVCDNNINNKSNKTHEAEIHA